MTPRRLPLDHQTLRLHRRPSPAAVAPLASPGWTRKTLALAMHAACLALFWVTVVAPIASPLARGELAREFKPLLDAHGELTRKWTPLVETWAAWAAEKWSGADVPHGADRRR